MKKKKPQKQHDLRGDIRERRLAGEKVPMKGYLAVLGAVLLALGLLWWMPALVRDPVTVEEYVQACRDIAVRDHLILPVEESEYLRREFESGQSPEMAMSEWAGQ